MSNLAITFASLVKNNNGRFQSEKQFEFLISQCETNEHGHRVYVTSGSLFHNSWKLEYVCDDFGVVYVIKHTGKKSVRVWEYEMAGKVSVQAKKEIKRLERMAKETVARMVARNAAYYNGDYALMMDTYHEANIRDNESIIQIHKQINFEKSEGF